MNTRNIKKILGSDIFVRHVGTWKVLPRDNLPLFIDGTKTVSFFTNTDPSDKLGEHWIALHYNGCRTWQYFDLSRQPVIHPEISDFIKRNSKRPCNYNPRMLQYIISIAWGLYAVYLFLIKTRGGSQHDVLRPFSTTQQWRNDRLVYELVKTYLKKCELLR